jgi:Fe-S-cluster containining protein
VLTDLVQIRLLGEKKRAENERFRKHLKSHPLADRRFRRIAEDIEAQIDCTVCANCCRVATARLVERDVERIARHIGAKRAEFLRDYTEMSAEEGLILKRTPAGCIFLDGTMCTIYDARPHACENFPHVVRGEGSVVSRMWDFNDRACYCPIVYNTLERVKDETGFRP